ncbi:nucleotidyltransferase domain-containing protein, partial [Mycobacterium ahvazicum]
VSDQESVWDYPRPPRVEPFTGSITVELGGHVIASTSHAWRVLETSHPPTYYLPRDAFADGAVRSASGSSWCEWKGRASYYDLVGGGGDVVARKAAWSYLNPTPGFESIAGALAVMAAAVDRCTVNGEVVTAQPGGFYGGWITSWVIGPFKGVPGSAGW